MADLLNNGRKFHRITCPYAGASAVTWEYAKGRSVGDLVAETLLHRRSKVQPCQHCIVGFTDSGTKQPLDESGETDA